MSCSGNKRHFSQHSLYIGHLTTGLQLNGSQHAKASSKSRCKSFQGTETPRYLGPKVVSPIRKIRVTFNDM